MTREKRLGKAARLANVVLGGGGVVCVFVLFYLTYYYAWTGERRFTSSIGTIVYFGLPAVLAGLLFASLRLRPSYKINLALLFFSTGVSVYGAEAIMILWFSLPSVITQRNVTERVKAAKESGVAFDTRSVLEVVDDLRAKGVEAYPTGFPAGLLEKQADGTLKSKLTIGGQVLPLGGISNRVSVL
ncbi:MAG: hypothetical protein ACE5JO_05635, partial [Candidatus Binatia bacterium]